MTYPRKVTYRAGLFEATNLITPDRIDGALAEFSAAINQQNYEEALRDLLDKRQIIELVLSGIDEGIPLKDWIMNDFPTDAKEYENSFASFLLSKLAEFYLFYSSSVDPETAEFLKSHHQSVKAAAQVFKTMSTLALFAEQPEQANTGRQIKKAKAKGSQRETKQVKRAARERGAIDAGPFAILDLRVPEDRSEADTACKKVLARLENILDVFLQGIRRPEVADVIRMAFIPQDPPQALTVVTTSVVQAEEELPPAPTIEDPPSAFPMVNMMKAALYPDTPDGFGEWKILLSSRADSDLRDYHRRDGKIYGIIIKKIRELSVGFFSADNQKRLSGPSTSVPVFEAKMTNDLRLVYTVDCITAYDNSSEVQALRLFGIFTHRKMDNRLWKSVSYYLSNQNQEYRQRCLARKRHPRGGNIYLPQSFPAATESEEVGIPDDRVPSLPPDDSNQLHHIISLEKYVALSKDLLDSIEGDRAAAFPFEVSKYERTIIQHPHSCYVLGRSGTGKTTTMLFKMLLIERDYQLSDLSKGRPRQIFVTKSRVLAGRVEEHFVTYLSSLNASAQQYQSTTSDNTADTPDEDIFNEEDNVRWRSDLPKRFSELEDKNFPLFVTFDRLCSMIEADIDHSQRTELNNLEGVSQDPFDSASAWTSSAAAGKKGKLVTFDRFVAEYWPRFPQNLKRSFRIIEGSELTIVSEGGYLDHETYKTLSLRMQPTFAEHRDVVYQLFLVYRRLKNQFEDFDVADRTHSIIRAFAQNHSLLQKVSHLYVDETQDNLLIDTLLLRMLCRNSDGLFWAGDTAQTISAGSAFRFDDLKSFQYRIERKRRADMQTRPKQPKMFYLSVNYRSHAGIVNCAHSIIQILMKYWEKSIDFLPRERGNADGSKPIFYTELYPGFVEDGHFLSRDGNKYGKIEMGAHQCLLVRDEKAKEKLFKAMGRKIGNVLTLYESKGLEFNDVFLYNFFHDSAVDASQWRMILNEVSREATGQNSIAAPSFDPVRHAPICFELKCLYVALTRARNNIRIADESLKGEPMRNLWESYGQISSCAPGHESTDFAEPSSQEEWADRAKIFFDNEHWFLAKQSYEKAGKKQQAAVSNAYYLREVAYRIPTTSKDKSRQAAFASAAEAFSACAGNTTHADGQNKYLELCAKCYEDGGDTLLSARVYRRAHCFAKAAELFRKLGRFEDVLDLIKQTETVSKSTIPEPIRDVTRLYFVAKKEFGKAHQLFDSVEEEMQYLDDRNLDLAQLDLLLLHGRKSEAADLLVSENRLVEAIDLLLSDDQDIAVSMSKAKDLVLRGLWDISPFGVIPDHVPANALLEFSRRITSDAMDDNSRQEVMMFEAILLGNEVQLGELGKSFLKRGNVNAAALCLDHYFNRIPQLADDDITRIAEDLRHFFDYVHILHDLAFSVDPTQEARTWKLFGIKPGEDDGTFTLSCKNIISIHSQKLSPQTTGSVVLTKEIFLAAYRECLRERLLDRVTRENDAARRSPALHRGICIRHTVYQNCDLAPCPRSHTQLDECWSRSWIHAHLLQMLIYHSISTIQFAAEMRSQRRFWLLKLYEVLNPASHHFGSTSNMMNEALRDLPMALNILMDWVRAMSYTLEFHPTYLFLTIALASADFSFTFDSKQAAGYMYRSNFAISACPQQYLRGPQSQNVLQEMLMAFDQNGPSSLVMGILVIRHVIERDIPVNIHVLCSFIERISSSLIICNRHGRTGSLHSVILPRSWMSGTLKRLDLAESKSKDSSRFWLLLQPLQKLLRALYFPDYTGNCQLKITPDFHSVDIQGTTIRNLFIARICRVLGLLGTNIAFEPFRNDILSVFASIRKSEHGFSRLFSSYFYAQSFHEVVVATRRSMLGSPFDEMVQLLHSGRFDQPVHEIYGLRRIVYSTTEELFSVLELSSKAEIQIPEGFLSMNVQVQDEDVKTLSTEIEAGPEDNSASEPFLGAGPGPENPEMIPETEIPADMYLGHSPEEEEAARIIQHAYVAFRERKKIENGSGLTSSILRWFLRCKETSPPKVKKEEPPYPALYLGPLPSLLAALDFIQSQLVKANKDLNTKLSDLHHEELERFDTQLTLVTRAMSAVEIHCLQLKPGAAMHTQRNVASLKSEVKAVVSLEREIRGLLEFPEEVHDIMALGHKVIVAEERKMIHPPRTAKLQKRPHLNFEELQDLIDECWDSE